MILNILTALTASAGLYILFLGLYSYVAVSITGKKGGILSTGDSTYLAGRRTTGLMERLEKLLYRARLDVSAHEFLTVAGVCGLLAGGFMFLATSSLLASGAGFASGLLLYWMVLLQRQEKNLESYETAMPNALRDLRSSFRLRGLSLVKALEMVAEHGPEIVRQDFQEMAAAFSGARIDLSRLQNLMGLRGSYTLDRVAEALLQFHTTPQRIPEILDLLIPRLRKEVSIRREMRANISGPKRELLIVVLMPFIIVFFFRFAAPDYAAFYSSMLGQILILAAWVMDVLLFILANTIVKRIVNPVPYQRTVPERRRVLASAARPDDKTAGRGETKHSNRGKEKPA